MDKEKSVDSQSQYDALDPLPVSRYYVYHCHTNVLCYD